MKCELTAVSEGFPSRPEQELRDLTAFRSRMSDIDNKPTNQQNRQATEHGTDEIPEHVPWRTLRPFDATPVPLYARADHALILPPPRIGHRIEDRSSRGSGAREYRDFGMVKTLVGETSPCRLTKVYVERPMFRLHRQPSNFQRVWHLIRLRVLFVWRLIDANGAREFMYFWCL